MKTATLDLAPDPASVPAARSFVQVTLSAEAPEQCADAVLLTSELVANAVLHTDTPITVILTVDQDHVRVEVFDGSPELPQMLNGMADTMAGRGLHIIEGIARQWGAEPLPDGKLVWFEL